MIAAPVLGVSTVVLRGDRVLLVERGKPPYEGFWSLPGGRVEAGERLIDAARREVAEETGLSIDALRFLDWQEIIGETSHVVIAVFTGRYGGDALPQAGDDAREVRFATDDERVRLQTTPDLDAFIEAARAITRF